MIDTIAIAFTLKGQTFEEIKPALHKLSELLGGKEGRVVLAHGFMTRQAVVEKGFSPEVVDALAELFPFQAGFFVNGKPQRNLMADFLKKTEGVVYAIGEIKEGVLVEVELYESMQIPVYRLPLDFDDRLITEIRKQKLNTGCESEQTSKE